MLIFNRNSVLMVLVREIIEVCSSVCLGKCHLLYHHVELGSKTLELRGLPCKLSYLNTVSVFKVYESSSDSLSLMRRVFSMR